jgi:hypothetical protein
VDTPSAPPLDVTNRRDVIVAAMKNPIPRSERPRDPTGKFLPLAGVPTSPVAASPFPTPAAPRIPMPKALKMDLQPHWDAAPDELRQAIIQREADSERGIQPLKEKARQADEFMQVFGPYQDMIRNEGGTPTGAMTELLRTAAIFRSNNPGLKAQAIAAIMRQYQIPLEHVQPMLANPSAPAPPSPQPMGIDPQQISQLVHQELSAFQQQQLDAQSQSEVDRFASNPEHKYFTDVQDWMASLMTSEKFVTANQGKTPQEKLQAAYETALRVDPDIFQRYTVEQQAKQTAEEKARQQVASAKNAAVQVKGAPASGPAPKPNPQDRRAVIANAFHSSR